MEARDNDRRPSLPLDWPVVVVGAGAAGLLAAARAAMLGRPTLLLEKNRKLGVKILISGGTRCNVTHATDERGIASAFPKYQGRFLRSPLAALPPGRFLEWLHEQGVATKTEPGGKVFPVSDRAIDVRDALVSFASAQGVTMQVHSAVETIEATGGGSFHLVCRDGQRFMAARLLIACGGQSYPGCGTSGDGYAWARSLEHTIVPPVPALTPILCAEPWLGELAGLTIADASLTIVPRSDAPPESLSKQAILQSSRGSLLFTHAGLSGPIGLNVSRAISRSSTPTDLMALADFLPGLTLEEFRQQLATRLRDDGRRQVSSILAERLPRSLALTLLMIAQVPAERRGAELNKRELAAISRTAKHCPIHPLGTAGFLKAEVTAGGVSLEEVDSRTMQSKLVPNLFFAGEVLDIDGPIGGFNFQAAFSTGWLAGSCMAR